MKLLHSYMTVILFYILQKNYLNKSCILFKDLLPYITSLL